MTVQDARERMQKLRADLVAAMRTETPADPKGKGTRKLVIGALSVLTPRASLLRKLARCGRRNEVNDFARVLRPSGMWRVHGAPRGLVVQGTAVASAGKRAGVPALLGDGGYVPASRSR